MDPYLYASGDKDIVDKIQETALEERQLYWNHTEPSSIDFAPIDPQNTLYFLYFSNFAGGARHPLAFARWDDLSWAQSVVSDS